jgi:hypothetical protein
MYPPVSGLPVRVAFGVGTLGKAADEIRLLNCGTANCRSDDLRGIGSSYPRRNRWRTESNPAQLCEVLPDVIVYDVDPTLTLPAKLSVTSGHECCPSRRFARPNASRCFFTTCEGRNRGAWASASLQAGRPMATRDPMRAMAPGVAGASAVSEWRDATSRAIGGTLHLPPPD